MEALVIIFIVVIILGALFGGKSFGGTIKNGLGCMVFIAIGLFLLILIMSSSDKPEPDKVASKAYSEPKLELQRTPRNINEELKAYSEKLVGNKEYGISNPQIIKTDKDIYVITFDITDPKLIADHTADQDTNPSGFEHNMAITELWITRFCTSELKSIINDNNLLFVTGKLRNSSMLGLTQNIINKVYKYWWMWGIIYIHEQKQILRVKTDASGLLSIHPVDPNQLYTNLHGRASSCVFS